MAEGNKRKITLWSGGILSSLALVYALGPREPQPDFSSLSLRHFSTDLKIFSDSLLEAEATYPLKPDNHARIVWATPYQKTTYSMVYLHGNGASQEEGDPIHEALAHRYGCNLYLSRLADHGLEGDDPMLEIDAEEWMQSALDAIAIGKAIGDKVILVSCSTGSTLGLYLQSRYPDLVEAHIMLSPNIDVFDRRAWMMTLPWALQTTRMVLGSTHYGWQAPSLAQRYWYTRYRAEGLLTLKSMINASMDRENFNRIDDPVFMAYYYRDESHQDKVVSVNRMREMFSQLSTPTDLKKELALPDAGTHIIGSDLFNAHLESLWPPLTAYCESVLQLMPVHDSDWRMFLDFRSTE